MEPEAEVGLGVELRSTVAELANSTVSVVDTVPYRAWVSVKPLVPLAAMAESVSVAVSPESDATVQSITKLPMVRELMTMEDVGTPRIRAKSCFSAAISSARRLFNSDWYPEPRSLMVMRTVVLTVEGTRVRSGGLGVVVVVVVLVVGVAVIGWEVDAADVGGEGTEESGLKVLVWVMLIVNPTSSFQ
jgi:hypothetical protein